MELSNETFLHGEKYKILSKISQGNFGITYLAKQTSLERKVCIKEFFFRGSCERSVNGQITVTTSGQDVISPNNEDIQMNCNKDSYENNIFFKMYSLQHSAGLPVT